jgi:hypothetical protein
VKSFIFVLTALVCAATPAFAQSEGQVSVGASITVNAATDDDVESTIGIGPLVRLNPRTGWGPAGAFNWFRSELRDPAGGDDAFGRLRVRPLMAGVAYTIGNDTVLTSFSIVAGPSFNKADFDDDFAGAAGASIDAENSFAVRPGVGITWTVAPRVAIIGFGGYLVNRPDVTYRDRNGIEFTDRWKADSVVLSVGAVYSIF